MNVCSFRRIRPQHVMQVSCGGRYLRRGRWGREGVGRFVPSLLWESKPLRSLRRGSAAAIGLVRAVSERRREVIEARSDSERLLRDYSHLLVEGPWSLLLTRKRFAGRPIDRLRKEIQPLLLLEGSVETSVALRALGLDPERRDTRPGGWSGLVPASDGDSTCRFRPTIALPRHSGKYLLFDLGSRNVLRISPDGFSTEYERLRRAFSTHVPSVGFEVLPGRDCIVEPFVEGRSLPSVDEDVLLPSVAGLLERLPEVSREFGEGDSMERLITAVDTSDPALGAHEARSDIVAWLGTAPQSPAHADLVGVNVVVTDQGPLCIDFGDTSLQPAWFDGLQLALHTIRRLEGSGTGRVTTLDPLLYEFLRRTVPVPPPRDWRRLAALGYRALTGRKVPTEAWIERLD